ncbi:MAG: PDZ domain-containing protein [Peptococcaceae bacterium]
MVFIKLIPLIIYNLISLFSQPIFWLVMLIIWFQFRRMAKMKSEFFNVPEESVVRPTIIATIYGIIGGLVGSFILVLVGISILEVGIQYLWILAIAMMLVNQRFMCFAYAGGVVSLSKYFLGYPEVSIPQVMGLVAILHLVEAVLILLSGHLGAVPVYVKGKHDKLIGGFNLQKFWPLPIVAMVAIVPDVEIVGGVLKMPDWWPLIKAEFLNENNNIIYQMIPVIAGLGYGDIALTALPKEKTSRSASYLAVYSLILLGLAIIAANYPAMGIFAALFAPCGHEFVIFLGRRHEFSGEPLFTNPPRGVMVLDLLESSPLKSGGLRTGDIILAVNGVRADSSYDLDYALQHAGDAFEIEFLAGRKKVLKRRLIKRPTVGKPLGLILVPDGYGYSYLDFEQRGESIFKKIFGKIFK